MTSNTPRGSVQSLPLIEQIQVLLARLSESREIEGYKLRLEKEIAQESNALDEMHKEKRSLVEELKELRAEVALEKRTVEHWQSEMKKLRAILETPRAA